MKTINERIQFVADKLFNSNISLFEKECGLKPATLKHVVKGRLSKPSYEVIESICRTIVHLNIDWLITGIGEMERKECSDIDTPIRKRINELFDTLGISPESVFNNLAEKEKIVRQIEKREDLSADVICAITDRFPAISTEWILRGEGSMLISSSLGNDQLSRLEDIKQELDMIKGENRLLREQLGLGARKESSESA